jgi:hypothetical protein
MYLLVDNQEQYQPYVDVLMYKLIQMEENRFHLWMLFEYLLLQKLKIKVVFVKINYDEIKRTKSSFTCTF